MVVLCLGIFFMLIIFALFQSAMEAVSSAAKFGCGSLLVLGIIGLLMEPSSGSSASSSEGSASAAVLLLLGLGSLVWFFSRDSGTRRTLSHSSNQKPAKSSADSSSKAHSVKISTNKEADRGLENVSFYSKHTLPGLVPPAGYICVIRQRENTDIYRFVSIKSPQTMGFGVELPVKSSIAHMFRSHNTDSTLEQLQQHFTHRRHSPDPPNVPDLNLLNRLFAPQEELYEFHVEDLQEIYAMGERIKPKKAKPQNENTNAPSNTSINWKSISTWTVLLILALVLASLAWNRLAPAFFMVETNSQAPAAIREESKSQTKATAATTRADAMKTYTVLTDGAIPARVRSCPGTACDIIGRLEPGATVRALREVEGTLVNGSVKWIEVEHDGASGYIHSSLLK